MFKNILMLQMVFVFFFVLSAFDLDNEDDFPPILDMEEDYDVDISMQIESYTHNEEDGTFDITIDWENNYFDAYMGYFTEEDYVKMEYKGGNDSVALSDWNNDVDNGYITPLFEDLDMDAGIRDDPQYYDFNLPEDVYVVFMTVDGQDFGVLSTEMPLTIVQEIGGVLSTIVTFGSGIFTDLFDQDGIASVFYDFDTENDGADQGITFVGSLSLMVVGISLVFFGLRYTVSIIRR